MNYQPSNAEMLYVVGCPEATIPTDSRSPEYRTLLQKIHTARQLFDVVCRTEEKEDCSSCKNLDFKMCDRVMEVFVSNGIVVIDPPRPVSEVPVSIKPYNRAA